MSKAMIRLSVVLIVAVSFATQITHAQVPGGGKGKASLQLLEKMAAGTSQDLIVIFDDTTIQKEAQSLRSEMGLPSHHSRIIEHKAARYAEQKQEILSAFGSSEVTALKHYSHLPLGFVRIHSRKALDKLLAHPRVVSVHEDRAERLALAESLPLIGQPQVAAQGNLGAGTTVAVLDTGVDYTKPAFGSCTSPGVPANCKVVYAQDFATSDAQLDNDGHGTNVAGIVLGVAPGAKIVALDVFHGSAATNDLLANQTDILSAISWVIANKATYNIVAINLSLGSGRFISSVTNDPYNSAVDNARSVGILTIAAAGNDGYTNALAQPAATAGVVSVGAVYDSAMGPFNWRTCPDATSAADKVTCFSNSASFLTLLAPGSQILAAGITESGTSQAAPHVAGAVAVLRAAFPNESLDQTVARLTNGVMVTDSRNDITKPRLHLQTALANPTSCTYAISGTGNSFGANSSSGSIAVTTSVGCTWGAASNTSNTSWLTVTSGSSGSGSGTVNYSISANSNVTSRTGTVTVAGQTYTITQSGSVGAVSDILHNPGFESGPVSWTDATANGLPVITSYLNPTATNSWYAWLCGYDYCADNLYQDITIPANALNAYVQFNYWITTAETSSFFAYDFMTVRIYSPPNASTYTTLSNLTNRNATTGWVLSPTFDVSAFKGLPIRLQFSATTDSSFETNFYVDDVTLMVNGSTADTQPPAVPNGLTATTISTSAINLAWTASTDNVGVSAYKVYRSGILLATLGNVTSYRNTGLTAATTYSYTVSACDAAGNCSAQSVVTIATTAQSFSDTQPPTVPTGLTATAISASAINLSWGASSDNVGVTQYKVYRNGILLTSLGNVTNYSNTSLVPSTPYSYTVQACDAAGNCSAQSTAVTATTPPITLGGTPITFVGLSTYQVTGSTVNIAINKIQNNSFTLNSGSLRLELWALTAPYTGGGVTGYVTASIRTNLIAGLSDQLLANSYFSSINLNLPFTAPPPTNSSYVLFLLEYDSVNCAQPDHFCIINFLNYHELQAPTVPTGFTATAASSSQINLSWTASTDNVGVASYYVYRSGTLIAILGNVTSYSNNGLTASTAYSYTVSACDTAGNCSAQSAPASATTPAPPDTQPPTVPTGLSATVVSGSRIDLAWTASSDNVGVTAYKIYSSGNLVSTLGNVTGSSRTNTPSTTYSYTVAACDAAGNCSAQSTPVLATTPALPDTQPPTVPTGLTATPISGNAINLNWTAATDNVSVASYKVYRGGTFLATVGNVTNYGDTGLRDSTGYSYTVQACDAAGNCSAQTTVVTATTSDTQAPTIPAGLAATAVSSVQINLAWSASTDNVGVTQYKVYRNGVLIATLNGSFMGYGDSGLAAATLYNYAVAACDAAGNCSAQSTPSAVTTLPAGSASFTPSLAPGWNLFGNSLNITLNVQAVFGTPSVPVAGVTPNTVSIWKWDAANAAWAYYAPQLTTAQIAAFTTGKGYLVLSAIGPGEGYWVNAATAFTMPAQSGAAFLYTSVNYALLPPAWNLIATAQNVYPSSFTNTVSQLMPPTSGVNASDTFVSLWAWDAAQAAWYYYSPVLENTTGAQGGLTAVKNFAASKGYLHFQDFTKKLDVGTGFWVNKP